MKVRTVSVYILACVLVLDARGLVSTDTNNDKLFEPNDAHIA